MNFKTELEDTKLNIQAKETKIREIKTKAIRRAIRRKKIRSAKKKLIQECTKNLEKKWSLKEEGN